MSVGFGLSFYGYFALAAVWMVIYFVWTERTASRDRKRDSR